jgi:hypothetical protein
MPWRFSFRNASGKRATHPSQRGKKQQAQNTKKGFCHREQKGKISFVISMLGSNSRPGAKESSGVSRAYLLCTVTEHTLARVAQSIADSFLEIIAARGAPSVTKSLEGQ